MSRPATSTPAATLAVLVRIFPKLSETFILEEILGLERQGLRLRLYSLAPATDAFTHAAVRRVRAPLRTFPDGGWRVRLAGLRDQLRLAIGSPARFREAWRHARRVGRLAEFPRAVWLAARLKDDGITHLHAHFIAQPGDVAELAARLAGIPFSLSAHAKDIYLSAPADLARKLRAATFTVTCTEANRQVLAAIAPGAPIHRLYHGIDHGVFAPRDDHRPPVGRTLLSVGRLREKKGLDVLIEACARLRDRGLPVDCEIVGYGEAHDALQARIQELRLTGSVRLLGKLAREQVIAAYRRAAVYVQPSRIAADGDRDGIPNVLLEAMAMCLPVVASRVSGIPELVQDARNGLLVPPDDPQALADALATLLADPARGAILGREARATVLRAFDNDRNLRLLCRLLDPAQRVSAREGAEPALPALLGDSR